MVDIHSHILWDLDDGSESYEQTIAMLKAALEAGTTDIVATPHANSRYVFDPAQIEAKILQLAAVIPSPHIHRGCDFHLSYENIEAALNEPDKYTINHRNYLLVEFSDAGIPGGMDHVFAQLRKRGMIPVITHPERNALLMRDAAQLARWVEQGCLLQVTAQSLTGGFGPAAANHAWELMGRRIVHAVASDAHDPVHRHPRLTAAYAEVEKRAGHDNVELLFDLNPRRIIEGCSAETIEQMTRPPRRRWFSF
jgi:protein-tyrosine phosphatase